MNNKQRAARRLDRAIDRYADKVGAKEMEAMLQERAQDMREQQDARVTEEDIELGDNNE